MDLQTAMLSVAYGRATVKQHKEQVLFPFLFPFPLSFTALAPPLLRFPLQPPTQITRRHCKEEPGPT